MIEHTRGVDALEAPSLRILAICNYPSATRPTHQVFVRELLRQLKTGGAQLHVVAPESWLNLTKRASSFKIAPLREVTDGIAISRPRYLTYSSWTLPGSRSTIPLSYRAHCHAVESTVKRMNQSFDVCFAHFLYPHGNSAQRIGQRLGIPTVLSLGESTFERYPRKLHCHEISKLLQQFDGVITNSHQLKRTVVNNFGLEPAKVQVFPNGVDHTRFFAIDQRLARQTLGLPVDHPIVVFVGQFNDRKGPLRVLDALRRHPESRGVFIGSGPQTPAGPQVLHAGRVPHDEVSLWLNAGDIFVLPTLNEGCCNALLEAMSCGLPIISSALEFNHELQLGDAALLIDPTDVEQIGEAIATVLQNPRRRMRMQQAAQSRASDFQSRLRAERILEYLRAVRGEVLA